MSEILIRVVGMDLAQLIITASENQPSPTDEAAINNLLKSAEELLRLRKDLMAELAVNVSSDAELIELVREHVQRSNAQQSPTWECPVCHVGVGDNLLVCPTCVPADEPATQRGILPVPEPRHQCGAHGETACGLCVLNPCVSNPEEGCSTYRNTGMHWDGCPHRVVKVTGAGAWVLADGGVVGYQDNDPDMVHDVLSLVCVSVPDEQVQSWTAEQRQQAVDWAAAWHLAASDNQVVVPDRPVFLPLEARHAHQEETDHG
jgi:hypothetical protein